MVLASTSAGAEFYAEDGLSLTGRFLVWLAEHGPAMSKELSGFFGRTPKSERQPIIDWLSDNGYIEVGRTYNGRQGHPPVMHSLTTRGRDWADILASSKFVEVPTEEETKAAEALEARVTFLEDQVDHLVSRIAELEGGKWTLTRVG